MGHMYFIPGEVDLTGVYFVPLLVNGTLAVIMTLLTVILMDRFRLSRFFLFPQLTMLAMAAIYTVLLSLWVFPA